MTESTDVVETTVKAMRNRTEKSHFVSMTGKEMAI